MNERILTVFEWYYRALWELSNRKKNCASNYEQTWFVRFEFMTHFGWIFYIAASPYIHIMMTSSNGNIFRVTAICAGNSPVTGQWLGALMFSLICAWINAWVNNREDGDLRRRRSHYDVIVMWAPMCTYHMNIHGTVMNNTPQETSYDASYFRNWIF